jgi:hypothetical protein
MHASPLRSFARIQRLSIRDSIIGAGTTERLAAGDSSMARSTVKLGKPLP